MMTRTDVHRSLPAPRIAPTVAIVSKDPDQYVLDAVLDRDDCAVVLIDSLARAYSDIKRLTPQMVILCIDEKDVQAVQAVQVLTMLSLDPATARIPVVTHVPPSTDDWRWTTCN